MIALLHDVHNDPDLEKEIKDDIIFGVLFHEILYADDTVIYSRNAETVLLAESR